MIRAKQLNKLEQEEDLGILTRFVERHTKDYSDAAIKRYFLIDRLYTLIELYRKWYKQRGNNNWEDFYIQLDKKVVLDQLIIEKQISYIKGILVITSKKLKD